MYEGYISHASPESSGYVRPGMKNKDGKKVKRSMHVLVAKAFIPNPENKSFVCHINRNKADNRVENLIWCTRQEKERGRIKSKKSAGKSINQLSIDGIYIKTWISISDASQTLSIRRQNISDTCKNKRESAGGFKWKYHETVHSLPNEEWKTMNLDPSASVKVSSFGRIWRCHDMKTYGSETNGYMYVRVQGRVFSVHRLICQVFKPIENSDKYAVDHIDGNKRNNHVDNLEWVTDAENSKRARAAGLITPNNKCRKILQLDNEKRILNCFDSIKEATNKTGVNKGSICLACRNRTIKRGEFFWQYQI